MAIVVTVCSCVSFWTNFYGRAIIACYFQRNIIRVKSNKFQTLFQYFKSCSKTIRRSLSRDWNSFVSALDIRLQATNQTIRVKLSLISYLINVFDGVAWTAVPQPPTNVWCSVNNMYACRRSGTVTTCFSKCPHRRHQSWFGRMVYDIASSSLVLNRNHIVGRRSPTYWGPILHWP